MTESININNPTIQIYIGDKQDNSSVENERGTKENKQSQNNFSPYEYTDEAINKFKDYKSSGAANTTLNSSSNSQSSESDSVLYLAMLGLCESLVNTDDDSERTSLIEALSLVVDVIENRTAQNTQSVNNTTSTAETSGVTDSTTATETDIADDFANWSSGETLDKYLNGEEVEDFKMFDIDLLTYSTQVKNFSQQIIDKYDTDSDGQLSYNEFYTMSTDGAEATELTAEEAEYYSTLLNILFTDFQMDNDSSNISAAELAAQFIMADIDWDNYEEDSELADLIDGKLNFVNYNTVAADPTSSSYNNDLSIRQDIYNNFYSGTDTTTSGTTSTSSTTSTSATGTSSLTERHETNQLQIDDAFADIEALQSAADASTVEEAQTYLKSQSVTSLLGYSSSSTGTTSFKSIYESIINADGCETSLEGGYNVTRNSNGNIVASTYETNGTLTASTIYNYDDSGIYTGTYYTTWYNYINDKVIAVTTDDKDKKIATEVYDSDWNLISSE